ncbi:MAG: hypothetical protein B0D96_09915 [Candidatus Sedimenticola endophacoides]|uniref:Peptidase M52 n=1 Tax=Candidatus Sedimenticola endophacoides TaxID=2548426 RepID=A0A657PST7_9GAMM|nr:MAG: hypothetical protein B0D94_02035 [Candidatus Sedimenticola endophacoides]OQX34214.1 MAG: hypothetical protein B0D96_09915 [Candidatus Sedimenticola endophacoides]OQX42153.1 MAG: hypothetical protein B0D89_01975 [Candidatus Sedimenticola endophacoides]OQX44407.1 MAG: hypothetical protein B0D86_05705 [Candidatus Sedimenticola endophacoides]OQX47368.1 MAG: hypothetical protein B0D87_09700 [Candidatus Sedimenticola endophacoides]
MRAQTTLVLGIGNNLLTDEGAGIHVIELLARCHPDAAGVSFIDGGTLSFTLAEYLATHDRLIVVDAARIGAEPGGIDCFEGEAMDRYLSGNRESVHEVGLMDLLDICRLQDHYPQRRALIGIQPLSIDWGEAPSEPVARALPEAGRRVMALIERWDRE